MSEECRKGGYRERGFHQEESGEEREDQSRSRDVSPKEDTGGEESGRTHAVEAAQGSEEEPEEAAEGPLEQKIGLDDGLLPVCLLSGESARALRASTTLAVHAYPKQSSPAQIT